MINFLMTLLFLLVLNSSLASDGNDRLDPAVFSVRNYKTTSFILLTILILSFQLNASSNPSHLNSFIDKSDLIIHVELIDKFSKKESMLLTYSINETNEVISKDVMINDIFTTYIFKIKEVLSGDYNDPTIEVKMSGGCDEEEDICLTVSINYEYSLNQEGVIFLKYDNTSGNYFSYSASRTAFKVGRNNTLYTGDQEQTEAEKFADKVINKNETEQLGIESLKQMISQNKSAIGG